MRQGERAGRRFYPRPPRMRRATPVDAIVLDVDGFLSAPPPDEEGDSGTTINATKGSYECSAAYLMGATSAAIEIHVI